MSDLLVPFIPDNIALPQKFKRGMAVVDSDLYNVAQRLKEVHPALRLVYQDGQPEPWVVMMDDPDDGQIHFVSRYEEADARIITDVQRMQRVPAAQRFQETLNRIDRENAKRDKFDPETEEFERMAFEFRKALKDSGLEPLANAPTPVSRNGDNSH